MTQPFEDIRERLHPEERIVWSTAATDIRTLLSAVDALMEVGRSAVVLRRVWIEKGHGGTWQRYAHIEIAKSLDALPPELKEALE